MFKNKLIGIVLSAIMVSSMILAAVPLGSDAAWEIELEKSHIWGYVGVSASTNVNTVSMDGVTVVLYRSFDLYGMEEVDSFTTSNGEYFEFFVNPGYYVLGVESMTKDTSFYHINEVLYPEGMISLGLVDYNTHTERDIPLKEEKLNAHFYGHITEGGSPVSNANVMISDPIAGFSEDAITDALGSYSIDVYQDTFDIVVSVDGISRYFDSLTVTDIADANETFKLTHKVFNPSDPNSYSISISGGNLSSSVWDNGMGSYNLSVLNAANKNHLIITYDYATQHDQDNITDDYNSNQSIIDLDGKVDFNITVYNGTENDPGNWTVLVNGTDYNVTYDTGMLNITKDNLTDNDFLFVNYTRIHTGAESKIEDLSFIGRNWVNISIASSKITWKMKNSTTGVPLPFATDVHVAFYNTVTKNVYSMITGPSAEMYIPDGSYVVVIRPDGYNTYTDAALTVSGGANYSTTFVPMDDASEQTTNLVFPGDDWNNLSITRTYVLNSYDDLAGLGENLQNIRLQIDTAYGNGDGLLAITEVDAFEADMVNNKHPEMYTTEEFFTFNGTAYSASETSYQVSLAVPDLGGSTTSVTVNDSRPVTMTISLNYSSNEAILLDEDLYSGMIYPTMDTGEYRISLPATYAQRGSVDYNVPVAPGKVDVVFDSVDDFAETPLSIGRISAPSALIIVESIPVIAKNNGSVFFVKNSTIVPFDGVNSNVANGTIVEYMWNWGDGSPDTSWSTYSNATHNFTTSYNAGRIVTLTVKDSAGQTASTTVTIVPDGDGPKIAVSANKTWVGQGESIEFNSTGTADGGVSEYDNMSFEWVFGDSSISSANISVHSFSDPGTYTVFLNVTDEVGNTGSSSIVIHVNDTTSPIAQVVADRTPEEDKVVVFNASISYDGEGNITNYTWNFGDGNMAYGIEAEFVFSDPGDYTVYLNITDEAGNIGTLPVQMSVLPGPRPNIGVSAINVVGEAVNGKETKVQVVINNSGSANCTLPITVSLYETIDGEQVLVGTGIVDALLVGEEGVAEITWIPSSQGNFVLTANITSDEDYTAYNNVKAESITVDPNVVEAYGKTIAILAVIVVILVLILGREKIKDVMAASAEKKKENAKQAERDQKKRERDAAKAEEDEGDNISA